MSERYDGDVTRSPEWRALDVLLLRSIDADLEALLHTGGIGERLEHAIAPLRREAWEQREHARSGTLYAELSPKVDLAARLGFPRYAAVVFAAWRKARKPLFGIVNLLHDEAELRRQRGAA